MAERKDDDADAGEASHGAVLVMPPAAQLAAWRKLGADRCDALGFRTLEAMLGRAAKYDGAPRRVLDDKLARRIEAYAALVASRPDLSDVAPTLEERQQSAPRGHERHLPAPSREAGPLAKLLTHLPGHESNAGISMPSASRERSAVPELKSISQFRGTWSRLRADRSLQQSRSTLPDNAGPLNSHNLVHRSLRLMRAVSPGYLNHFVAYADALAGLEQLAAAAAPPINTAGTTPPRKQRRSKSG